MQRLKNSSFFSSKITKSILLILFPFFICFITELGHMQSVKDFLSFALNNFGIIIFDVVLISAIFWFVSFLCNHTWIGGLITCILFFASSCVEYYKFYISGAHFLFSDLAMTKNVADMAQFTRIHFNMLLFILFLLTFLYAVLLWLCDVKINKTIILRSTASVTIGLITVLIVAIPSFFTLVSNALGIDKSYSFNAISDDDRFINNNFITNFTVSLNQQITNKVEEPLNYSEELVNSMLEETDSLETSANIVKPNVIFIMSESFGDFRNLNAAEATENIYKKFDLIKSEAFSNEAIVPTFGGNTVRTEFELMFGLPVKSLKNATIPHSLLPNDIEFDTFAQMYKNQGYSTTYLHPFSSSFYDRKNAYSEYGFDKLIFVDDLTVPVTYLRNYVDDDTLYRQTEDIMAKTSTSDYIYITTMQNHQPYGEDGLNEVEIYLDGVQKSCEELYDFFMRLKNFKEPTVVLFIGDHLPFFSPGNNLYSDLGITTKNCAILYNQPYIIWNNYNLPKQKLPDKTISAFYLPHVIYNYIGLPANDFNTTLLNAMEENPVYSVPFYEEESKLLDTITYDRTIGMGYSDEEIVIPFVRKQN